MFIDKALFLYEDIFSDNVIRIKEELKKFGFSNENIKGVQEVYKQNSNVSKALTHLKALKFAKKNPISNGFNL